MERNRSPEVSVVVPARNSERTIEQTIQSLLALEYPRDRLELILVDNASTDGTSGILAAYSDRLRRLYEPKRGAAAARNRGILGARHPVIAFTDADCIVDPDWLWQLVVPLEDASVGISGGGIRAVRPCNAVEEYGERIHDHEKAIRVYKPPYAVTATWASRQSVLLEVGGFDESLPGGEDVDLAYRIVQAGYRLAYCAGAIVHHHNRSTLKALFREGFNHGLHSVRVLKKHRDFVDGFGHRRFNLRSYRSLAASALRAMRDSADSYALCDTVFNSGKKAGKILGSLRWLHIDL